MVSQYVDDAVEADIRHHEKGDIKQDDTF